MAADVVEVTTVLCIANFRAEHCGPIENSPGGGDAKGFSSEWLPKYSFHIALDRAGFEKIGQKYDPAEISNGCFSKK
jgi:hypothetical protein